MAMGSEIPEPIELKFGTTDDVREGTPMQKLIYSAYEV